VRVEFTDKANDFSLEIPEGAIPEGERLTVDVGWPSLAVLSSQKDMSQETGRDIKRNELVGYDVKRDAFEFRATNSSEEPTLEMTITQPEHGIIGVNEPGLSNIIN
ncbi:hypothetical protein GBAR_LOCUS3588, partial [Geodia barretti]